MEVSIILEVGEQPNWFLSPAALWCYLTVASILLMLVLFVLWDRKKRNQRHQTLKIGGNDSLTFEKKDDYQMIERIVNWLEDNYTDPNLSLDDLVAQSSLGRTAYINQMETLTQMSPKEFITNFRLKKAIALFNEHVGISVPDVVKSTGFSDPIYFAQAFKAMTGMSPTAYRKKIMAENETHGKG